MLAAKLKRTLITWAGVIAILFAAQWVANRGLVQGKAPPLQAPDLSGRPFAGLETLPKPALIYFWASWCPVCAAMEGSIAHLASEVPVITIALQSGDGAAVAAHLASARLALPTLVDETGALARTYGVRGVPAAFIVDGDGRIRFATMGYSTELGLRLRLWLAGF